MSAGVHQPVDGLAPVAPSPSLLTAARPLPFGFDQWRTGIAWRPRGCRPSFAWPYCPAADDDKEDPGTVTSPVQTDPFVIYTPLACEWATEERGAIDEDARNLTDVHSAYGLAQALWMGTGLPADSDQPTLRRSATAVPQLGSNDLDDVVAELLLNYERCTGGSGGAVLHFPSYLMTGALGGIVGGGKVASKEGNTYVGPNGSVISPGPGYPHGASTAGAGGYGPLTGGAADADAGTDTETYAGNLDTEAWIYVSGPVEYGLGDVVVLPDAAQQTPRTNLYEVWGERPAIVRFDPCCVFAGKVLTTVGSIS